MSADLDYQRNAKVAPTVSVETTQSLEDMIKARILAEEWDDVERRENHRTYVNTEQEQASLSNEKSKLGLGDIYAQEYEQQFLGA